MINTNMFFFCGYPHIELILVINPGEGEGRALLYLKVVGNPLVINPGEGEGRALLYLKVVGNPLVINPFFNVGIF